MWNGLGERELPVAVMRAVCRGLTAYAEGTGEPWRHWRRGEMESNLQLSLCLCTKRGCA